MAGYDACLQRFYFLLVLIKGYACAMMVHANAIQVLPELLMDHFDTLPTQ